MKLRSRGYWTDPLINLRIKLYKPTCQIKGVHRIREIEARANPRIPEAIMGNHPSIKLRMIKINLNHHQERAHGQLPKVMEKENSTERRLDALIVTR